MKRKLRDVLAPMTFKEKVDYIWEYYKLHILGSLCLLLAIGFTAYEMTGQKEVYVSVVFGGQPITKENLASIREQVNDGLIPKEQQSYKEVLVQNIQLGNDETLMSIEETQRFFAQVTGGIIDVLIMEEELFQMFHEQDLFLHLNGLKGFDTLHIDEADIIYEEGTSNIYGIRVSDLDLFENVEGNDGMVVAVIANSNNDEGVIEFLRFIFS